MIARVITAGVAVARGVGGRRGRRWRRAETIRRCVRGGKPWNLPNTDESDDLLAMLRRWRERYPWVSAGTLYPDPVGYRERRRRAKLRRRARDRSIARVNSLAVIYQDRAGARDPGERKIALRRLARVPQPLPWWSTPEGRRRWTEENQQKKATMRALLITPKEPAALDVVREVHQRALAAADAEIACILLGPTDPQ